MQLFTRLQTRLQNFVMRCAIIARLCFSYAEACISMCHFWAQNGPFVLNKNFLVQTIIITFIYLLVLFIVQNLKKFSQWIQSYQNAQFLGPKWPISPNENFFRKPVNEHCFFHSCLSTCQKSKSDINLLLKYWRLKNTEISLAERHFWL